MTLDSRLRDAMHRHADELDAPLRTPLLLDNLDRAIVRSRRRRAVGGLACALVALAGIAVVANRTGDPAEVTTVADEVTDAAPDATEAPDAPVGPVTTTATLPGGADDPAAAAVPGDVPGGVATGPAVATAPGSPVAPAGSPPTTTGGPTAPVPGVTPPPSVPGPTVPPPTVPVAPCTASVGDPILNLLGLRFTASGTGQPGATVEVTAHGLLGPTTQQTTVAANGSWTVAFPLIDAGLPLQVTVSCSTGEVIPLTLLG